MMQPLYSSENGNTNNVRYYFAYTMDTKMVESICKCILYDRKQFIAALVSEPFAFNWMGLILIEGKGTRDGDKSFCRVY